MAALSRIIVDATCRIPDANQKGRPGVGECACGVLIINDRGEEYEFAKYLGYKTVPEAEFEGLIFALDKASEVLRRNQKIEVWMDSDLVVKWMNKEYRLRREHIKPLFDRATELAQRFVHVEYYHHSRRSELARRADALASAKFKEHNG